MADLARLLFAALSLAGCTDPQPPYDDQWRLRHETLTISDRFQAERIEQIIAGIEVWNAAAPHAVGLRYRVGRTADRELEIVPRERGWLPEEPRASGRCCFPSIELVQECSCFLPTVVHELGHFFGLPHSDDAESVMYPRNRFNAVPTAADVAALTDNS